MKRLTGKKIFLNIRVKLILLLLAFGIIPAACVGGFFLSQAQTLHSVTTARLSDQAAALNDVIDRNLGERYDDVQTFGLNTAAYDPAHWRKPGDNNPLVQIINQYIRSYRIYKISALIGTTGEVLAVNTADGDGKSIDTSWIYDQNFANASWFVKASKGEFLQGKNGWTGTVVEPPAQSPLLQRAFPGEDGFSITFAAPVRDLDGKNIGVWVNFATFDMIDRIIVNAYKRLAAIDMPSAELTLLDSNGTILSDVDPSQSPSNSSYVRDFKTVGKVNLVKNGSPAAVAAIAGGKGALVSIHSRRHIQIINGYAHSVGANDFPGLGWSMLVRAPVEEGFAVVDDITFMLCIVLASCVVLTLLLGWYIGRRTARPIVALGHAMTCLARDDINVPVPGLLARDELGDMARSVDVLKEATTARLRLEAEAKQQREAAEADRAQREASAASAASIQAKVVDALSAGLEGMAAGDLTTRVEDELDPAYEGLRSNFNAMAERLQDLVAGIVRDAALIRAGTTEIAGASDDLSRRTEQQAASLQETATALDEITSAVRRTADGTRKARSAVAAARLDAARSGDVVRDAVAAMAAIEDSSRRIAQIIGVIDEIAFQTNLLALNAGVEAARAGDAGRGFAVVASEVRALAQRSADAAKEIKALIATSAQHVCVGVQLVGETGQALTRIVDQVGEIDGVVDAIATSAQEQATGLQEVNTGVNLMDGATQENAAMVEQSTAAVRSLAEQTEELVSLASQFQIGAITTPQDAPRRAARVRHLQSA